MGETADIARVPMVKASELAAAEADRDRLRGDVALLRHVVEQQTEFLRTGCDIQPQVARDRAKVFIGMGIHAVGKGAGDEEAAVIKAAVEYVSADRARGSYEDSFAEEEEKRARHARAIGAIFTTVDDMEKA